MAVPSGAESPVEGCGDLDSSAAGLLAAAALLIALQPLGVFLGGSLLKII